MSKYVIKYGLGILAILTIGLTIVINTGVEDFNFTCDGIETVDQDNHPIEFSLRIEKYRWFIFWSDDDGSAYLETHSGHLHLFPYFSDDGIYWHFADKAFLVAPFGRFSTISNKTMIGLREGHTLEGRCQREPIQGE